MITADLPPTTYDTHSSSSYEETAATITDLRTATQLLRNATGNACMYYDTGSYYDEYTYTYAADPPWFDGVLMSRLITRGAYQGYPTRKYKVKASDGYCGAKLNRKILHSFSGFLPHRTRERFKHTKTKERLKDKKCRRRYKNKERRQRNQDIKRRIR